APKLSVDVSGRISKDEIALANAQVSSTIDQSTVSTLVRELSPETKNLPTLSGPSKLNVAIGSFTLPLDTESKPVWSRAGRANITIQSDGRTVLNGIRMKSEASERDLGRLGFQSLKFNASLPFQTLFGAGQPDARSLATDFSVSILGPAQSPLFAMRAKADVEIDTAKPVGPLRVDVALERIDTRQLESMFDTSGLVASIVGDTIDFNTSISTIPGIDRNPLNIPASTITVSTDMRATGLKTSGPVVVTMSPKSIELKSPAQFDFKIVPSVVNELISRGDSKNASLALARSADFRISVGSLVLPKSAATRFSANASISTPDLRFTDSTGREIALADIKALVATESVGDATPLNFSFESKS
ncbi:hypothetical protein EBR21_17755, partial [bacterium]|nr:hypothetical protein [bacterium]